MHKKCYILCTALSEKALCVRHSVIILLDTSTTWSKNFSSEFLHDPSEIPLTSYRMTWNIYFAGKAWQLNIWIMNWISLAKIISETEEVFCVKNDQPLIFHLVLQNFTVIHVLFDVGYRYQYRIIVCHE